MTFTNTDTLPFFRSIQHDTNAKSYVAIIMRLGDATLWMCTSVRGGVGIGISTSIPNNHDLIFFGFSGYFSEDMHISTMPVEPRNKEQSARTCTAAGIHIQLRLAIPRQLRHEMLSIHPQPRRQSGSHPRFPLRPLGQSRLVLSDHLGLAIQ